MRTFIGFEGHYEIYDSGTIILHLADEIGKLTGSTRKINNAKRISNEADRNGVLHLLQVMRIYSTLTQKV